jgi:DNA-binding transcriptional LysR family regulator
VLDRETELGLVTSRVSSTQLESQALFSERILLVASPDFVVPRHPTLDDIPLILFPPSTGFRQYLNDKVGTGVLARQVKMETDSVEAIQSFVMMGLGGSFLPVSSVKRELAARGLKQLRVSRVPPLSRTTSVLHRRDRRLGAAAQSFLRVISATAGSR